MGIPVFFRIISEKNNQAVLDAEDITDVGTLYVDMNGLIHPCVAEVLDDKYLFKHKELYEKKMLFRIENEIKELIETYSPERLYLAIDGVAPAAKMKQQRERRYKAILEKQKLREIKQKLELPIQEETWDKNCISPGTAFMKKVSQHINETIVKSSKVPVIFSDSMEVGEGEHKILKDIREWEHGDRNILVHGLDADLIMLSLASRVSNIYLLRVNGDERLLFDIDELKVNIVKDFRERTGAEKIDILTVIDNYIFVCFFLGNDFLPKIPGLDLRTGAHDQIMNAYSDTYKLMRNHIVNDEKIDFDTFRVFLSQLVKKEDALIKRFFDKRRKLRKHFRIDAETREEFLILQLRNSPTLDNKEEAFVINNNNKIKNWRNRYYYQLTGEIDRDYVGYMCEDYLKGLIWLFDYYFSGCRNYHWYYHYEGAPTLNCLLQYLVNPSFDLRKFKHPVKKPVHHYVQLISILPFESREILPVGLTGLFKNHPRGFRMNRLFKRYFYECEPVLPHFNFEKVRSSIPKKYLKN